MFDVRRSVMRRSGAALACVVALTLLLATAPVADAKVPRAPHRYTSAIEPLADYVGQSVCSPAAKKGTSAFANMLLRTYRNSRSLGISRACGTGGVSEHKEGRAFDWGVSVHSARDRKSVKALFTWLLKTDRHGNRYAMARRLGIQYMIWNRRIWGSYAASSGWRRYTGANPHTDHVHFSLSWAGARKKTSYWHPRTFPHSSGSSPKPPKPAPNPPEPAPNPGGHDAPDPQPDSNHARRPAIPEPAAPARLVAAPALVSEQVSVATNRRAGTRTRRALVRGHRYLIEATGTFRYDRKRASVADPECSRGWSPWTRDRSLRHEDWDADHLDLYIDGQDLYAQADDGQSCDLGAHTYRWVYEAERSGRTPLAVWDPTSYRNNSGRLRVRVTDLDRTRTAMAWTVPARSRSGATSPGTLRGGEDYVVTVAGTWRDGTGVTADAECSRTAGDATWRRSRDVDGQGRYDAVLGRFGYDSLVPQLSRMSFAPVTDNGQRCDAADHRYTFVWNADRDEPLNIRVDDPRSYADNTGALRVKVLPLAETGTPTDPSPSPSPEPAPAPEPESLQVEANREDAVRTTQEFAEGTPLRVTVSGFYLMRGGDRWVAADAECTVSYRDYTWRPTRYDGLFHGAASPLGDLAVNGGLVSWRPSDGDGSCDEAEHVYTVNLTTDRSGPLWFEVADDEYGDNRGALAVRVEQR